MTDSLVTALSLVILGLSCDTIAAPPKPVESEYLIGAGGGFSIEDGEVAYGLTLEIRKPLPVGHSLSFSFENPVKGGASITETANLEIGEKQIVVKSEPLQCIRNNRRYTVTIAIHIGETTSEPVSTHTQKLEFKLPKQLIKQVGIELC